MVWVLKPKTTVDFQNNVLIMENGYKQYALTCRVFFTEMISDRVSEGVYDLYFLQDEFIVAEIKGVSDENINLLDERGRTLADFENHYEAVMAVVVTHLKEYMHDLD